MSRNKMEVMVDLETLSTRHNAVILVIGAVKFNRYAEVDELNNMDSFYVKIDINSCRKLGMHTDDGTIEWWNKQDPKIREEAMGDNNRVPLRKALQDFSEWFKGADLVWSQGATFDIPILEEAYALCGISPPWKFYNARDTRTIYDLAGMSPWRLPKGKEHNALFDCWRQVWGVKKSFKKIM